MIAIYYYLYLLINWNWKKSYTSINFKVCFTLVNVRNVAWCSYIKYSHFPERQWETSMMFLKYYVDILLLLSLERFWSVSGTLWFSNAVRNHKIYYVILTYYTYQVFSTPVPLEIEKIFRLIKYFIFYVFKSNILH